jgi:hypothetical protein
MPLSPLRAAGPLRVVAISAVALSGLTATSASAQAPAPPAVPPAAPAPAVPPAPAPAPAPTGRKIKPGVTVAGVDLTGQTREQAIATLTPVLAGVPSDKDVTVRIGGKRHRLEMDAIDYGYDIDKTASRARNAKPGTAVTPVYGWDDDELRDWSSTVEKKSGRSARDATVRIGLTKHRISSAKSGWRVTIGKIEDVVEDALDDPQAKRSDLLVKTERTRPNVSNSELRSRYGTVITVDRKTFKLRLFKRLKLSKTYKVAVGADGHSTPAGMYSITSKQVNPAWHVPNSAWAGDLAGTVVPGGAPNNPLKARWLGLRDAIGIHGTGEAGSIGSRASHGCIRMRPSDVIDLYDRVPMGATVKVV